MPKSAQGTNKLSENVPVSLEESIDSSEALGGTGESLFDNFTRSDLEEQLPQIRIRREVIDPVFLRGLNMRWVNTTTVEISPGDWGHPTGIFESKDTLTAVIPTATADLWWYVFIAVSDDDATKFKTFVSKSRGGGNPPSGFNRFRYVGVVKVDTNNEVRVFTQDGLYNEKRYYVDGISVYTTPDTSVTEITLDLPEDVFTYTFGVGITASGNVDIVYRFLPSVEGAPAPTILINIFVTGARTQFLGEQFNVVLTRNMAWHDLSPGTYTGFVLNLSGWVDNL